MRKFRYKKMEGIKRSSRRKRGDHFSNHSEVEISGQKLCSTVSHPSYQENENA